MACGISLLVWFECLIVDTRIKCILLTENLIKLINNKITEIESAGNG